MSCCTFCFPHDLYNDYIISHHTKWIHEHDFLNEACKNEFSFKLFFIFCVFNFQFELTHTEAQKSLQNSFMWRIQFHILFLEFISLFNFFNILFFTSCYCCCCRGTWCSVDLKYYSFARNLFHILVLIIVKIIFTWVVMLSIFQ